MCDRHEGVWRCHGKHYACCNTIYHDWFGGGSVVIWGINEGCTDLHMLAKDTLTTVGYWEINPQRHWELTLVQWALGPSWCMTMSCQMWLECEDCFCIMRHWCHWQALGIPGSKSNWEFLGRFVSEQLKPPSSTTDYPWAHWCPDPGLGGFLRIPSTISSGACPDFIKRIYEQACGGHAHYWLTFVVAVMKFIQVGSACKCFFCCCFDLKRLNILSFFLPFFCNM